MLYYILENRWSDGRVDGYYGGRNKKYSDMIDYVPKKEMAYKFEKLEDAESMKNYLNKYEWNYYVVPVEK